MTGSVTLTRTGLETCAAAVRNVDRQGRFEGEYAEVGVAEHARAAFVGDLEVVEQRRTGGALLRSMSPDVLSVAIAVVDRRGSATLSVALRPYTYLPAVPAGPVRDCLEVTMALDPSLLPTYVRELRRLVDDWREKA